MVMMSATKARSALFTLLKRAIRGHELIRLRYREGDAILMSEEDYEGLVETIGLLKTPGLRASLARADRDIKAGRTYTMDHVFGS